MEEVKTIFFEVFPTLSKENFDWDNSQQKYENWDSFAHLQLITMAEEKFNIKISVEEATSIITARHLLDLITSHT